MARRRISDGQSGYRALSRRAAEQAHLEHDRLRRHCGVGGKRHWQRGAPLEHPPPHLFADVETQPALEHDPAVEVVDLMALVRSPACSK